MAPSPPAANDVPTEAAAPPGHRDPDAHRASVGHRDPDAHPPEPAPESARLATFVREHPWVTAIMIGCTLGGALLGPVLLEETWSLARQVGAGAFLGAWVGLTVTVTKMIG